MSVADSAIQAMGKRTMGGPATPGEARGDVVLQDNLEQQFAEISATSTRFKGDSSLGKDAMDELRVTRVKYFERQEKQANLDSLEKKLAKSPDDVTLLADKARIAAEIQATDATISTSLKQHFGGWQSEVQMEIARNADNVAANPTDKDVVKAQAIRETLVKNLVDPARVFGNGHRREKTNELVPDLAVTNVPVMQYLEKGFIRDDAYEGGSARNPKPTFNADALSTLARFGLAPGSTFGDTMHFDFIEGYNSLIDGGRAGANMRADRASPENGLPPTAAMQKPPPAPTPSASPTNLAPRKSTIAPIDDFPMFLPPANSEP